MTIATHAIALALGLIAGGLVMSSYEWRKHFRGMMKQHDP